MAIATKKAGNHVVIQEEEDLLIFRFGAGEVTGDEIAALVEFEQQIWPSSAHVFSITSLDDDLSITPGALTRTAKLYQSGPPRTSAFIVRRHYLRTAMEFLVRTVRLLGAKIDIGFFEDEAKAREWMAKQRSERAGK